MNKFIKYPQRIFANNLHFTFLAKCLSSCRYYSVSTVQSTSSESETKANKYSEKYKLSEEEIQKILKKPKKKPNILAKTEIEREDVKDYYEKSIEEKIGATRFNTVKEFNTQLEIAQKLDIGTQEIKPSDRPDVKYYKYDLPIPNIDPGIEGLDDIFERERKKKVTTNQKIWEQLSLDVDSSYENYEKSLQNQFKFELDMYGDVVDVEQRRNQEIATRGENILPMTKIEDEKYMQTLKDCFTLNINMPGTLENEDPNKFIRGLRPIEEFRHTPLIPISEKIMEEHKKKLEEYHRGGLYFEVKKETVANYFVFFSFCVLGYNLFNWLMEKDEEVSINYERMKLRRLEAN